MMAFTHVAAGAASALALSNLLHAPATQTTMFLAGGVLGGLLPDIDHPASSLGRRVLPLSMMLAAIFGHRGITHSLIAAVVVSLAAWYSLHGLDWRPGHSAPFVLGLSAGYLSHLLADWLTNTGVPLLWPMKRRFAAPVTISTGSPMEYLIALGLYAGLMFYFPREFGYA
jgi:inner membrane protein